MPVLRYALLLVATTAGGILSSFLWLVPNGLMAGTMAFCFSLGTIWLAEKERRKPEIVKLPDALAAGAVSGMSAIFPVLFLETFRRPLTFSESDFLRAPDLEVWYLLAAPLLMGIALHWSYYERKGAKRPLIKPLLLACASVSIIRLVLFLSAGGWRFFSPSPGIDEFIRILIAAILFAGFGPALFAALWVLITLRLDPAREPGRPVPGAQEAAVVPVGGKI
jgi:hypothetical protein